MCTVGGRIGWIVARSGTARRPGIPGTTTTGNTVGSSVAVPRLLRWALDSNIALVAFLYNMHAHTVMVSGRK